MVHPLLGDVQGISLLLHIFVHERDGLWLVVIGTDMQTLNA